MVNRDLQNLRRSYESRKLTREELRLEPFDQFNHWLDEARSSATLEPNAMALSTIGKDNRPSSRMVLLKGLDHGFIFYSNYNSHKGQQLEHNPQASLLFWWQELERQVRIEGRIERVDAALSDQYFHARPLGSQIGAIISNQSQVIDGYKRLEVAYSELEEKYQGSEIPRPAYWGGFRLVPDYFEFWQGRANRVHDRFCFSKQEVSWDVERLAP